MPRKERNYKLADNQVIEVSGEERKACFVKMQNTGRPCPLCTRLLPGHQQQGVCWNRRTCYQQDWAFRQSDIGRLAPEDSGGVESDSPR